PGGYQVGSFPWQWTEWNGKYRDAVRRFWRGDAGTGGEFASRIAGSSDLYELSGRKPCASINFVTAHDGFTLEDQVSYEHKHNFANLEDNRDGHEPNYSRNFGVEGPTTNHRILAQREKIKRAILGTLFVSQGVPMLLGGDEIGRTKKGNNNTYCQDNELNWYDWDLTDRNKAFLNFTQSVIAFRRAHPNFRRHRFLTGRPDHELIKDVVWWHPSGREMNDNDWSDSDRRSFGMLLRGDRIDDVGPDGHNLQDDTFLILLNAQDQAQRFTLPHEAAGDPVSWEVVPESRRAVRRQSLSVTDSVIVKNNLMAVLAARFYNRRKGD
ncbi:MAG: glycogen debranching enzyme GlgX, partial [Rhodothermales bacterium]|nr:glycogen debranching enzyme GlgX [Rhodothermales bacterium]